MIRNDYEKPQSGNPHRLTIRQHFIQAQSIRRFIGAHGKVQVQLTAKTNTIERSPTDDLFVKRRSWDQRAEEGYMRDTEIHFQIVARKIIASPQTVLSKMDAQKITRYFALWYFRSRLDMASTPEIQLTSIAGEMLSKDQEEFLESKHTSYVREGGRLPLRQFVGLRLQSEIDTMCAACDQMSWGIIETIDGEFIHPDVPSFYFVPLTPEIGLVGNQPSSCITKATVKKINQTLIEHSEMFYFARNLERAREGVTLMT